MDYGTTGWATSLDAAVEQAETWISTTADAKGWSSADRAAAADMIEAARANADGWWSDDIAGFFTELGAAMSARSSQPGGWAKLAAVFSGSAVATVASVEEAEHASSASTIIAGTVTSSAQDVADIGAAAATAAGTGVRAFKSPIAWALAAALVVGGFILSRRR